MKTTGDKILDRTLDKVGGKGLFVKELDKALLEKQSDLSVHSLKDMPMEVSEELPLLAFSRREDPRDVLVLPEGKETLDFSRPIGCASLRRILQLQELFPEAEFKPIRGNLQTRLRKLDEGEYGALILAAAGLKRLGLEARISRYFSVEEVIPAAGQGILGVQGRKGEDFGFLEGFGDPFATAAALAERAFVRELDGGCSSPVAAHGEIRDEKLFLRGLYYHEADEAFLRGTIQGDPEEAEDLGICLARALREAYGEKRTGEKGLLGEIRVSRGKVWLVGAGPGDPGLFTLKGKAVLEQAEVVVYDALVGQSILNMIPERAELINVGKRASNHTMPQQEINQVLVREARKGKRVVRLKGGDPFLFGRGGEELELLTENRIPYEVVPGVTSAIAVPAYNGIPVTHRDFCSSLHIITGHKRQGEAYNIDFEALVRTKGTLVFLMGVSALPDICRGLLEAGMDAGMPAAILQKGTTAGQKRIVATVSTLEEEVKRQGIETPAIIVVGKVCGLAERFEWYEKQPLAGKKILVTRPKELISQMAAKLRSKGAEVLELPAIRTVPIRENAKLKEAIGRISGYDWLVFTSPTGVRIFFDALKEEHKDLRALAGVKLAVIGSGTGKELKMRGLYPDLMPEMFDGEALGAALAKALHPGEKVLIPRAALGNPELIQALEQVPEIQVEDIPTYDTVCETQTLIDEKAEFENGTIDYAVFTSASTVRGFADAVRGLDFAKVHAVCIGRQTKAAADRLGMQTAMSEKATMDSVVECVEELCLRKNGGNENGNVKTSQKTPRK
ncbi:MAG: uroporphyrinogen-III C-methyltransferase, partial [Candidatus Limivivens sp.]|nr:uroporphyrinogen-III C-methyltransferase [Candidatus Limivivens sp.]